MKESNDIRVLISKMSMSQKIKTAMFGDTVARSLLIKDPNKLIQQFVLKNPQITMEELHAYAQDPNTPRGVLRTLSDTQKIVREYAIKQALCFNPKTPLDISTKWVRYLQLADLNKLQKSKSVPNALTVIVRKKLADLKKKK
jgi:pentose-5-phosphate-3-epimerase